MRKFLIKIAQLILLVFLLLNAFDAVYTYVFTHFPPRNKTQFVAQLTNEKIDYVFLGSSRVQKHIDTKLVEKLTSRKAMNLGINGAKLDHTYLMLKLLIANKVRFDKLFIQIDYNYNLETNSTVVSPESLPFVKDNIVIEQHLRNNNPDYFQSRYIPFYRYAANDFRIGFRAFFITVINKGGVQDFRDGFEPEYRKFEDIDYELPDTLAKRNAVFESIDSICKKNDIDVIYFCSPFCSKVKDTKLTEKLKKRIPSLYDFSKEIDNDSLFVDCGHLNKEGAQLFTKMIVQNCILKNTKKK